jgi:hypothetical protein
LWKQWAANNAPHPAKDPGEKQCLQRDRLVTQLWLPYFIEYNAHTSIVRTWISQWLLAKKLFYFSRIISQELIIPSLFIIKPSYTLSQLPSMFSVQRIFQHHFPCKKCTLYSIKYSTFLVGRHASVISLPPGDIILSQLACPLNDSIFCLLMEYITYLSTNIGGKLCTCLILSVRKEGYAYVGYKNWLYVDLVFNNKLHGPYFSSIVGSNMGTSKLLMVSKVLLPRCCIFSCVRPFYEWTVIDLDP